MTVVTDPYGIGSGIQAVGGMITQIAAYKKQMRAVQQQYQAAKDLIKDAELEQQAILREGDLIARNARQRAFAANEDLAFLDAQTDQTVIDTRAEGRRLESRIIAQTAGNGLTLSGSPLLVAAEATVAAERAAANAELTRQIGTRRLQFEIERELQAAQDAQEGSLLAAEGTGRLRERQAAAITQSAYQGDVGAKIGLATGISTGTQALLKAFGPSTSANTPRTPAPKPTSSFNAGAVNRLSAGQDGF